MATTNTEKGQKHRSSRRNTQPLHVRIFAVFMSVIFVLSGIDTRAFAEVANGRNDGPVAEATTDMQVDNQSTIDDASMSEVIEDSNTAVPSEQSDQDKDEDLSSEEPNAPPAQDQSTTTDMQNTSAQQVAEAAEEATPAKLGATLTATLWAWDADAKKTLGDEPAASVELEPVEGEQNLVEGITATLARDANDQSAWTIKLAVDPAAYPELTATQLAVELDGKVAAVLEAQLAYDADKNDSDAQPQKLAIEQWNATKATLEAARGIATMELTVTTDAAKVDEVKQAWEKAEAEKKAAEEAEAARKAEEQKKAEEAEAAKKAEAERKAAEEEAARKAAEEAEAAKKAEEDKKAAEEAAKQAADAAAKAAQNATFSQSQTVDGTTVTVTAGPGVFPQGAKLRVKQLGGTEALQARAAAARERDAGQKVAKALTFDICVLDADGREIEPNTKAGQVQVSFTNKDVANQNLATSVYHVEDSGQAERLDATEQGTTVVAPTDGFSSYTVEFTYNELQYVMQGDTTIPLQDILDFVGLTGTVTDASSNAPELFDVQRDESGTWQVVAKKAFSTTHALYVTIDGVRYEIVVTDQATVAKVLAFFKTKYKQWQQSSPGAFDVFSMLWFTDLGVNGLNAGNLAVYQHYMTACYVNSDFTKLFRSSDGVEITDAKLVEDDNLKNVAVFSIYLPDDTLSGVSGIVQQDTAPSFSPEHTIKYNNVNGLTYDMYITSTIQYYCDGYSVNGGQPLVTSNVKVMNGSGGLYSEVKSGPYTFSAPTTYEITWDGNGGTPATANTEVNIGDAIGSFPTVTRAGYTLDGWYTAATDGTKISTTTVPQAPTMYYAHWTPITYSVKYNGNGNTNTTVTMSNSSHTYDQAKNLTDNAYSRTGYTFNGWNTQSNGTGTPYANRASVKNLTTTQGTTVNLYAQWKKNTYTVVYNGHGNTGGTTANSTHNYDEAKNLTSNGFTKTGYSFDKWTTNEDGTGNSYTNGQSVTNLTATNNGTVNLYAQWKANTYSVTYDLNDSDGTTRAAHGASHPTSGTYDAEFTVNNPTRTGYTFSGWMITGMDSVTHTYGTDTTTLGTINSTKATTFKNLLSTNGTVTFTAQWTPNAYQVHFDGNDFDVKNNVTGTMADQEHTFDSELALTTNAFAKTGYTFKGWSAASGKDNVILTNNGHQLTDGATAKNLVSDPQSDGTSTTTLYAKWEANKYTLRYHANDGTTTVKDVSATYDEPQNAQASDYFTNYERTLVKWNTQADGKGTDYECGQELLNLASETDAVVDLYAQWTGVVPLAIYDAAQDTLAFTSLSWDNAKPYLYAAHNTTNTTTTQKEITINDRSYHIDNIWWDMAVTGTGTYAPLWASEEVKADVKNVVFDTAFHNVKPRSMNKWFAGFTKLENVTNMDSSHIDAAELTDLSETFKDCAALETIHLEEFATPNVTTFASMFNGSTNLKEAYLEGLDTTKATSTGSMFAGCTNLSYLTIGSKWQETTSGSAALPQALFRIKNSADQNIKVDEGANVPTYDGSFATTETMGGKTHTNVNVFAVRYEVAFHTNGGRNAQDGTTDDMANMTFYYGQKRHLSKNTYTHDGLAFLGWNTAQGTEIENGIHKIGALGAEVQFTDEKEVSDLASRTGAVVDLYAVWQKAYAGYSQSNNTLTFFLSSKPTKDISSVNNASITNLYEVDLRSGYTEANQQPWKAVAANVKAITFQGTTDEAGNVSFATVKPQSMAHWFEDFTQLTSIGGLANLDASLVSSLAATFKGCTSLVNPNLSSINNLSSVTSMASMFEGDTALTNVIFGVDGASVNTSSLTNMQSMFKGCTSLVDQLKFDGVTNKLDTSKVTDFSNMFADCGNKLARLDLSGLNTTSATTLENMFQNDTYLSYLKLGAGWQVDSATGKPTFPCYLYRVEPAADEPLEGKTGDAIPSAGDDGALWVAKVTVKFDSNRNKGTEADVEGEALLDSGAYAMQDQVFYYGIGQRLNEVRFEHRTKAFIGWLLSADATKAEYEDKQQLTFDPAFLQGTYSAKTESGYETTLYALWATGITSVKAADLIYTGSYLTPAVTVYGVGNAQLKEYDPSIDPNTDEPIGGDYTIAYYRSRTENAETGEYEYAEPIAANMIVDAGTYYACIQGKEGTAYASNSTWDTSFTVKPANLGDAMAGLSLTTGEAPGTTTTQLVSPKTYSGDNYYAYKDGATATLNGVSYVTNPLRKVITPGEEGAAPTITEEPATTPDYTVTWYKNRTLADDRTYVYDATDVVTEVKNAGTYYAVLDGTATGTSGNLVGKTVFTLVINKASLSAYGELKFTEAGKDADPKFDYNRGVAVEPTMELRWSPTALEGENQGQPLSAETDYALTYINNTECSDTAFVFAQAKPDGNYSGGLFRTFSIVKAELVNEDVAVADQAATGNVIDPNTVVTHGGQTLVKDVDYTLSYEVQTPAAEPETDPTWTPATVENPGTYRAVVKGIGNYSGVAHATFNVVENAVAEFTNAAGQSQLFLMNPTATEGHPAVTAEEALRSAFIAAKGTEGGTVTLLADVEVKDNDIVVPAAETGAEHTTNVTLNTNGHTINLVDPNDDTWESGHAYDYPTLTVEPGVSLTIAAGTGGIDLHGKKELDAAAVINRGTLTIDGAQITSNMNAIHNEGTLYVNDGVINCGTRIHYVTLTQGGTGTPETKVFGGLFNKNDVADKLANGYELCMVDKDGNVVENAAQSIGWMPKRSLSNNKAGSIASLVGTTDSVPIADQTFTGSAIEPRVVVSWTGFADSHEMLAEQKSNPAGIKHAIAAADYELTWSNNIEVATATDENAPAVKATGKGGVYVGEASQTFSIVKRSVAEYAIQFRAAGSKDDGAWTSNYSEAFTTKDVEPEVRLVSSAGLATVYQGTGDDENFKVFYSNNVNVGEGYALVKGAGKSYTGDTFASFGITPKDISDKTEDVYDVTLDEIRAQVQQDGGTQPGVKLTYNGTTLVADTDYTVAYDNNTGVTTNEEKATATITGTGNYKGTRTTDFDITAPVCTLAAGGESTNFASLQLAIDAAKSNFATITLLKDVTESVTVGKEQHITLALAGHTLTGEASKTTIANEGALTVDVLQEGDGATPGTIVAAEGQSALVNHGTLNLNKGTVESAGATAPLVVNGWDGREDGGVSVAALTISDGMTLTGGSWVVQNLDYGNVAINGGTLTGADGGAGVLQNRHTATVAGGTLTAPTGYALDVTSSANANDPTYAYRAGQLTVTGGDITSTAAELLHMGGTSTGMNVSFTGGWMSYAHANSKHFVAQNSNSSVSITGGYYSNNDANLKQGREVFSTNCELGKVTDNHGSADTWYTPMRSVRYANVSGLAASYPYNGAALDLTTTSARGRNAIGITWSESGLASGNDKDYTVEYYTDQLHSKDVNGKTSNDEGFNPAAGPVEPDTYYALVRGTERFDGNNTITSYTGVQALTVTIGKANIVDDTNANTLALPQQVYTGENIEPTFDVTALYGTTATLTKDTDYTVAYTNNLNVTGASTNAYAIVTGAGSHYEGTYMVPFKIVAKQLDNSDNTGINVAVTDVPAQAYVEGAPACPVPTVTYNDKTLHKDVDFTVSYDSNTAVTSGGNKAKVILTGIGNFTGTTNAEFDIVAPVAQIGEGTSAKKYGTLQQAIDEAGAGQTVILLTNVDENVTVAAGKAVTLDLAESNVDGGSGSAITVADGATLTIVDTSVGAVAPPPMDGGKVTSSVAAVDVQAGGSLYLTKGTIESTGNHAISNAGGVVMTGGTVKYGDTYQAFAGAGSASVSDGFLSRDDANASVTGGKELADAGIAAETWYTPKPSLTHASVSGLEARDYTGAALEVSPSVSWNGTALGEQDYTGAWYSNAECTISVTEIKESGTYYYKIVPAEGSTYIGEQVAPLVVNGQGATNLSVEVTGIYTYTGSAIKPADSEVVVKDNGRTLTKGTDYTLDYYNNTNAGQAVVIATGINNYSGAVKGEFTIAPANIETAQINASNVVDTGAAQTPSVTATLGDFGQLTAGTDYDVTFVGPGEDTIEAATVTAVGTYTVKVTGKGNFTGTAEGSVKVTANKDDLADAITKATTDKSTTDADATTDVPTDVAQALQEAINAAQQLKDNPDATDEQVAQALKNLEDAQAAYDKAKQPAQGTEGVGSLSELAADGKVTVSPDPIGNRTYTGNAIEPQVTVSYKADGSDAVDLEKGKDYLVEYQDNVNVGTATVTITGIGKFYEQPTTGTASAAVITKTFSITKTEATASDLTEAIADATRDKGATEADDSTVTVPDDVKKALEDAIAAAEAVKNDQNATPEQIADALKALEEAQAAYDQAKKPKDNSDQTNITDDTSFTLTPSPIPAQVYTGDQVRPKVTVKNGETVLTEGTDYVLSYENNVAKGTDTAKVTVHGIGAYKGSKFANFSIKDVTEGTEDEREAIADAIADAAKDLTDTTADNGITVPEEVKEALEQAIKDAEAVKNNPDASEQDIKNAEQALQNAQDAYDRAKKPAEGTQSVGSLADEGKVTVMPDPIPAQLHTGNAIKPTVTVTYKASEETEAQTLVAGKDYVVDYTNNTNVGTATATITGIGRFYKAASEEDSTNVSVITRNFEIKDAAEGTENERTALTDALADAAKDIADTTNDPNTTAGDAEKQALENAIKAAEDVLSNPDSTPQQIADALKAVEDAQTAYDKTKVPTDTTAERKSIAACTVDKIPAQVATGNPIKPAVTVKDGDKTLVAGTDYVVEYANNTEVSTDGNPAAVTITGIGAYKDNTVANFKIVATVAEKKVEDLKDAVDNANQDVTNTTNDNTTDVDAQKQKELQEAINAANNLLNQTNPVPTQEQIEQALQDVKDKQDAFDASKTPASGKITSVEVAATDLVYDNTAKTPALTVKVDGVARNLAADTDYDVTWVANTNAGTAIVVVTGKGNYTGGASATFPIAPQPVELPTATTEQFTYDGTPKTGVSVATGKEDLYTVDGNTATNAGNHTAYARLKDRTNYTWQLANSTSNADQAISWTIGKRNVSIKADNKTKTYGEDDPTLTYTIANGSLVSPTDLGVMTCSRTTDESSENVGEHDITLNYTANDNYQLTTETGKLTIQPADLKNAQLGTIPNMPYNNTTGTAVFPTFPVTFAGKELTEGTDYELEFATDESDGSVVTQLTEKRTYYARAKAKAGGNFTGTSPVGSFLVTDAVATVTKANGEVDDTIYTTLADAIAAAENNGTVTLLVPVTESVNIAGKDLTLDLGKATLTGTADAPVITVGEGATLNLRATEGGTAKAADGQSAIVNNGTLDVDLGEGKLEGNTAPAIANAATGNLSMESGFVSYNTANGNEAIQNNGGQATVTGGHFSGTDANEFVAPGYELVSTTVNDEPWYGLGRSLNGAKLELEPSVVTYNGKAQNPDATVSYLGTPLKEGDEYTIGWAKQLSTSGLTGGPVVPNNDTNAELINAGSYTATATGVGAYQGSTTSTFTILPYDITGAGQVTIGAIADQAYTGTAFTPELAITDKNNNTLVKDVDYDVTYVNNTNGPTAVAKVTGKGNYTGAATVEFKITDGPAGDGTGGTKVTSITMNPTTLNLKVGDSGTAKLTISPSNAANKAVTWVSANPAIATVNAVGTIVGRAAGTTTVIAMANDGSGKSATCTVKVTNPITTNVSLNKGSTTIGVGCNETLRASVTTESSNKGVTWKTSNAAIATVDASGKVVGKQAGTVTITATAKDGTGKYATCTVTVKAAGVTYRTHVQTYAWQKYVSDGDVSGTTGKAKRLEGINIKLTNAPYSGGITYRVHVQTYAWQNFVSDGAMAGTTGKAKRLEAIEIKLTGEMANHYDVFYRTHCQTYGWLAWSKNGERNGSAGYAKRLEGIQIVIMPKGQAPGKTFKGITQWQNFSYKQK